MKDIHPEEALIWRAWLKGERMQSIASRWAMPLKDVEDLCRLRCVELHRAGYGYGSR